MKKIVKNKKGTALFMALMILTGVLTVALGAASLITSGIKQSRDQTHSTKAYYASEAGAERVLWEIRKNNADLNSCIANDYIDFGPPVICASTEASETLANGAVYSVVYKSGAPTTTVSTGKFDLLGEVIKRSIQVSY